MRHYIIVKFKDKEILNTDFDKIRLIFNDCLSLKGVHEITLSKNITDRENRYDLMIEISMEKESLSLYDESGAHKLWKDTYSSVIEKKTIIDTD